MNPLRLTRMTLSPAIWAAISPGGIAPFVNFTADIDDLELQADYKTGSISALDAGELNAIVRYFQPAIIAEVGTYIGNSTRAMASAMRGGQIYTCDASNNIKLPAMYGATIEQFPAITSTLMFEALVTRKVTPDLFYIDGRLSAQDVRLMAELNKHAVIVLDDFEGIEKGVANASLLLSSAEFAGDMLVYPRLGGKTALMLPVSMLQLTAQ